jgi:hypothetical protein
MTTVGVNLSCYVGPLRLTLTKSSQLTLIGVRVHRSAPP